MEELTTSSLLEALSYMSTHRLPQNQLQNLSLWRNRVFKNKQEWLAALKALGIEKDSHVKTATFMSLARSCPS